MCERVCVRVCERVGVPADAAVDFSSLAHEVVSVGRQTVPLPCLRRLPEFVFGLQASAHKATGHRRARISGRNVTNFTGHWRDGSDSAEGRAGKMQKALPRS